MSVKPLPPAKRRLSRIIEGSIRDALNGHIEWEFDRRFVGSIVKRAVGTLSAQWPELFELSRATEVIVKVPEKVAFTVYERKRNMLFLKNGRKSGYVYTLRNVISSMAKEAKASGNIEREQACVDILKTMEKDRRDHKIGRDDMDSR